MPSRHVVHDENGLKENKPSNSQTTKIMEFKPEYLGDDQFEMADIVEMHQSSHHMSSDMRLIR